MAQSIIVVRECVNTQIPIHSVNIPYVIIKYIYFAFKFQYAVELIITYSQ